MREKAVGAEIIPRAHRRPGLPTSSPAPDTHVGFDPVLHVWHPWHGVVKGGHVGDNGLLIRLGHIHVWESEREKDGSAMLPPPKEPPALPRGSPCWYLPGPRAASRPGRVQPPRRPAPGSPRCSGGRPCSCQSAWACGGERRGLWSESPPAQAKRRAELLLGPNSVPDLPLEVTWLHLSPSPARPPLAPAFVPPVGLPEVASGWPGTRPPWTLSFCSLK